MREESGLNTSHCLKVRGNTKGLEENGCGSAAWVGLGSVRLSGWLADHDLRDHPTASDQRLHYCIPPPIGHFYMIEA